MNVKNRSSRYFSSAANKFYVSNGGKKKMATKTHSMPFMLAKRKEKAKSK